MAKQKKLNIPIYRGELNLIKVKELKELHDLFYDIYTFEDGFLDGAGALHFDIPPIKFYIVVEMPANIPILAHEALHATNKILDKRGIKSDFENDEAQAYLLEWIMEECIKFFI